jgi:hypothetical protein
VVKELLTREDYFAAVTGGEGVIVIVDKPKRTRTAHPLACPTLDAARFMEKVVVNERKNGSYWLAGSFPQARRELDAQPCHCT